MFDIIKQLCPVACEAFEDYVLHAKKFSRMEMELIKEMYTYAVNNTFSLEKTSEFTDREWKEFIAKLS
jgi:hypothetical protein